MGLHHQANHGRVFRGLDAKHHLEMEKRDSHGSHIRLNVPENLHFVNKAVSSSAEEVATLTSVVYMTVSADFTGPIAGYTTLSNAETTTAQASSATPTNSHESAYAAQKSAATARGSSASVTVISTVSPTSSAATDDGSNNKSMFLNPPTSAATTTASAALTAAAIGGTPLTQTRGATAAAGTPISATRAPIAEEGHGMSSGAKAGLAFGIIIALALAAGLLFFCWRRRRNPDAHQELAGGKRASSSSSFFGGKAMSEKHISVASERSTRTATTAPRLSLRPVTQFLPMLGGADNRKSTGNHLDVTSAAMSEKPKSMWERRSQNSQNPFEDANVISEKHARPESPPVNPFDEPEAEHENFRSAHSQKPSVAVETAAAVPVVAAAAPPRGPNNVHRVQLDFKPSMEDELELKSGQLVRMLHEYDDGWALCIRMDRTQQGVVPRTCLSKLPVKPRPQGPPPNGPNGRPPMSPGMAPRPLTPNGRERSGSNAGFERPSTPTGMPARKPVPGQAL